MGYAALIRLNAARFSRGKSDSTVFAGDHHLGLPTNAYRCWKQMTGWQAKEGIRVREIGSGD